MKYIVMIVSVFVLIGCSNDQVESETPPEEKTDAVTETEASVAGSFRNLDITVENNQIQIIGEARATDDVFYYQIEQGETLIVEETPITLDDTNHGWGEFQIELDASNEMRESQESPIVLLYVKSNDGEMINPNYVPIDLN